MGKLNDIYKIRREIDKKQIMAANGLKWLLRYKLFTKHDAMPILEGKEPHKKESIHNLIYLDAKDIFAYLDKWKTERRNVVAR